MSTCFSGGAESEAVGSFSFTDTTLEIPGDSVVVEDKWEFWVAVADTSQMGMVKTELAIKWLITMR